MIEDAVELKVAARHLMQWAEALRLLRVQLSQENPGLLTVTERAYVRRIEALQADIAAYLAAHPADIIAILPEAPPVPAEIAA